jgi:histidinol dehydrogenase
MCVIAVMKAADWQKKQVNVRLFEREERIVAEIIAQVKEEGDAALREWTRRLDGAAPEMLTVSDEEAERAFREVDDAFLQALDAAVERIRRYHEKQKQTSWLSAEEDGAVLGQLVHPLERVGIYVPGGRAAYPSTVLMTAIPAQVAGVGEIVLATPPRPDGTIHPHTLVAAKMAGVHRIVKAGGAQAIAALAYGTESVPAVDKIVGPGNIYVALAKRQVFGQVGIDSIAGPSEIVVIADDSAPPDWVAADLLSQAEHDPMASAILITPSRRLAEEVAAELKRQCGLLERKEIAAASLRKNGAILLTDTLEEAVETANRLAPEHLELMVQDPWSLAVRVRHAGAVFLGLFSPEAIGDYVAGPSHVLPTAGTSRFFSPLGVDDFVKKTSLISYSREAFFRDGGHVVTLAEAEGLGAHAAAIRVRQEERG